MSVFKFGINKFNFQFVYKCRNNKFYYYIRKNNRKKKREGKNGESGEEKDKQAEAATQFNDYHIQLRQCQII